MLPFKILLVSSLLVCHVFGDAEAGAEAEARFGPLGVNGKGFQPIVPLHASAASRSSSSDHSHCALLIPGIGKSSRVGHGLDVFNGIHGQPHHDGFTCISIKSVDAAFIKARDLHGLPRPKKPITTPQLSNLGRVLVETTKILAKQYSLPKDVVVNGLPLVDTLKTIIGTICFDFVKVGDCKVERYREYDGYCNNLEHPHWGASFSTFRRRIGPDFADGISAPRISKEGHQLPSARAVSAHVHRDEGLHDHAVTVMCVAWGQALDHDLTFTGETKLPGTNDDPKCCDKDANFPECFPIQVSNKDSFYDLFKQSCLTVTRSAYGVPYGCKLGPRNAHTEISSYIDGNWVYGSNTGVSNRLRLFKGGLLKSLPVFREFGMKDLMPLKLIEPSDGCIRPNNDLFCFDAGDGRVNEQLVLSVVHTLMMREHNRIATELGRINPHWGDEKLYHESRHIVAAVIQHITYNEFLPMVLGKDVMSKMGIILEKHGYFEGYDPKIDATITSEFITSAFRFGHSLLPSTIERWSPGHKYIGSQRLSQMLRQPYDLYKGGWCDQYIMGLCNQVAQAMDDAITQEVTNHLFEEPKQKFGMDLAALNMQRAREHGVPSYNEFRHFCKLHPIRSWHELEGVMSNKTVKRYADLYKHPDDIDLFSGGVSERPLPGALVGPLFSCLIGLAFKDVRYGDRFWYENGGYPSSFTPGQLEEIRKIKLSRVICDNSDDIKTIQVYVMVLPDHDINPRVPCKSGILPRIDLSKWRDHPSHSHLRPQHSIPVPHSVRPEEEENLLDLPESVKEKFQDPAKPNDQLITKNYAPNRTPTLVSESSPPGSPLDTRFVSQDFLDDFPNFSDTQFETSSGYSLRDSPPTDDQYNSVQFPSGSSDPHDDDQKDHHSSHTPRDPEHHHSQMDPEHHHSQMDPEHHHSQRDPEHHHSQRDPEVSHFDNNPENHPPSDPEITQHPSAHVSLSFDPQDPISHRLIDSQTREFRSLALPPTKNDGVLPLTPGQNDSELIPPIKDAPYASRKMKIYDDEVGTGSALDDDENKKKVVP